MLNTSLVARSNKMRLYSVSSKIEINFTHADVEWLTEILNSVVTTCSLKTVDFDMFGRVYLAVDAF